MNFLISAKEAVVAKTTELKDKIKLSYVQGFVITNSREKISEEHLTYLSEQSLDE